MPLILPRLGFVKMPRFIKKNLKVLTCILKKVSPHLLLTVVRRECHGRMRSRPKPGPHQLSSEDRPRTSRESSTAAPCLEETRGDAHVHQVLVELESPLEEVHRPRNLVADEVLRQMSPHLPQEVVGRGVRRVAGEHTYAVHLQHDEAESCRASTSPCCSRAPLSTRTPRRRVQAVRKGKRYYHRSPSRSGRTCCSGGTQVGQREPPPKPGREPAEIYAHTRNHD